MKKSHITAATLIARTSASDLLAVTQRLTAVLNYLQAPDDVRKDLLDARHNINAARDVLCRIAELT